jgi:hypothetical protein
MGSRVDAGRLRHDAFFVSFMVRRPLSLAYTLLPSLPSFFLT